MSAQKFVTLAELPARIADLKAQGKRVVATNGCFDILHLGHVRYLRAARALGDALIVGINGDESIRALKGPGRPINRDRARAEIIAALADVDLVAIFPEVRATNFLRVAHPDVYAKGGDYAPESLNAEERGALREMGARIEIIPFESGYSTTSLLERMAERDG